MKTLLVIVLLVGGTMIAWPEPDYRRTAQSPLLFTGAYIASPDPQTLARFYQDVFGAQAVAGQASDPGIAPLIDGIRLRTPGYGGEGPVLSFFQAPSSEGNGPLKPDDLGYAHICFEADDVVELTRRIEASGGNVLSTFDDPYRAPAIYAQDPDGNVIEVHLPFPTPLTPATVLRSLKSLARIYFGLDTVSENAIRFLHLNVNSRDWTQAMAFYQSLLELKPTGFERDYQGPFIGELTGVHAAVVQGQHVALPGYRAGGPTFEIFTYNSTDQQEPLGLSDVGVIAAEFEVKELPAFLLRAQQAGAVVQHSDLAGYALLRAPDGTLIAAKSRELPMSQRP